jgi:WD40 repeat protein
VKGDGSIEQQAHQVAVSVEQQGYSAVAFSNAGDRLVASRDPTEVFDVASGALLRTFWRSDSTLALHPEGEILATFTSDQRASAVRFIRLAETIRSIGLSLNVTSDGYQRIAFSPAGDAFVLMGHSYAVGMEAFRFPTCVSILRTDLEPWDEMRQRFPDWVDKRHYGFRWPMVDRLAFGPDGRRVRFATIGGGVVEMDLEAGGPTEIYPAHDGPVLALDASPTQPLLATARCDGEIKLWRLDEAPGVPDRADKPLTRAFLGTHGHD